MVRKQKERSVRLSARSQFFAERIRARTGKVPFFIFFDLKQPAGALRITPIPSLLSPFIKLVVEKLVQLAKLGELSLSILYNDEILDFSPSDKTDINKLIDDFVGSIRMFDTRLSCGPKEFENISLKLDYSPSSSKIIDDTKNLPQTRITSGSVGLERLSRFTPQPTQESDMDKFRSLLKKSIKIKDRSNTDSSSVITILAKLSREASASLDPIRDKINLLLEYIQGTSYGSLEENKNVASQIEELLFSTNSRVLCPREGCGEPAILQCGTGGGAVHGTFRFSHRINGRKTSHGGLTKLPLLKVVEAPVHGSRKPIRP